MSSAKQQQSNKPETMMPTANPFGDMFLHCLGMKSGMDLEDDEKAMMPTVIINELAVTNPPIYIPLSLNNELLLTNKKTITNTNKQQTKQQ